MITKSFLIEEKDEDNIDRDNLVSGVTFVSNGYENGTRELIAVVTFSDEKNLLLFNLKYGLKEKIHITDATFPHTVPLTDF